MNDFDKPLSEVFDLTRHPIIERPGVAIAFNLTSLAVLALFTVERFWKPITGLVKLIDEIQIFLFNGYYLFLTSAIIALLIVLIPLLVLFKTYELLR